MLDGVVDIESLVVVDAEALPVSVCVETLDEVIVPDVLVAVCCEVRVTVTAGGQDVAWRGLIRPEVVAWIV